MDINMRVAVLVAVIGAGFAGCGGRTSTPISPGPPPANLPFTISGRVFGVTPMGRSPLSGATIQGDGLGQVVTDADGAYELRGMSFAYYVATINVRKGGYAFAQQPVMLSADAHLDVDLTATALTSLSGVVSEVSAKGIVPADGVLVEILSCQDPPGCAVDVFESTTTDTSGAFSLPGLYAGKENNAAIWLSRNGRYYEDDPPETKPCDSCFRLFTISGDTQLNIVLRTPAR
jgi:hypothetical protein